MLKTVVLPDILVETLNKELYLIEIEIFCNSINVLMSLLINVMLFDE